MVRKPSPAAGTTMVQVRSRGRGHHVQRGTRASDDYRLAPTFDGRGFSAINTTSRHTVPLPRAGPNVTTCRNAKKHWTRFREGHAFWPISVRLVTRRSVGAPPLG